MYSCHHLSTQFLLGQSKTNLIVWGGRQNKLKCRHCVSVLKHSSLLDIGSGVKNMDGGIVTRSQKESL